MQTYRVQRCDQHQGLQSTKGKLKLVILKTASNENALKMYLMQQF